MYMYDRQCVHNIDACLCLNIVVAKHSNFFFKLHYVSQ